jgi:hypothetical protein
VDCERVVSSPISIEFFRLFIYFFSLFSAAAAAAAAAGSTLTSFGNA